MGEVSPYASYSRKCTEIVCMENISFFCIFFGNRNALVKCQWEVNEQKSSVSFAKETEKLRRDKAKKRGLFSRSLVKMVLSDFHQHLYPI